MKKYLNTKQTYICLGLAALIVLICIIVINIKPDAHTKYKNYAKKTNIFTMNDKAMTLDEAFFITKNKQAYYEEYYYTYNNSFNWDTPIELGKTYADLVLEETLQFVKEVFVLSEYAKENGFELTEKEAQAIDTNVDSFLNNSVSKIITATNATRDIVSRVYTRTALYDKVCDSILKDVDLTVDNEEARHCLAAIVEISPQYFDSPERIAEKILERANSGEVITEVAKIYDTTAEKMNIGKTTNINKELADFCLSLKDDQCKMTKIGDIYYVVYCYLEDDEVVTKSAMEALAEEKKASYITNFVNEIEKQNPVSVNMEAWNTIDFKDAIFTKADFADTK